MAFEVSKGLAIGISAIDPVLYGMVVAILLVVALV